MNHTLSPMNHTLSCSNIHNKISGATYLVLNQQIAKGVLVDPKKEQKQKNIFNVGR